MQDLKIHSDNADILPCFECRRFKLPLGKKTYVMGILNVTPDSFYDGGRYADPVSAVDRACQMVQQGADIIDIGGQSTRPGHSLISSEQEASRIVPIIKILSNKLSIPISVDTFRSDVAKLALDAGADIINDIWGLQKDSKLAKLISDYNAGVVIMHNKQDHKYDNLIDDMKDYFKKAIIIATKAGIKKQNIILDPGIGLSFGKTPDQSFDIIQRLAELKVDNLPILLATSRKSFIGEFLGADVENRLVGTIATSVVGIFNKADFIRVHDVKEAVDSCKITDRLVRAKHV